MSLDMALSSLKGSMFHPPFHGAKAGNLRLYPLVRLIRSTTSHYVDSEPMSSLLSSFCLPISLVDPLRVFTGYSVL